MSLWKNGRPKVHAPDPGKANWRPRRSERVILRVPVLVRGLQADATPFEETTATVVVSAHGALITLASTVHLGQSLRLTNKLSNEEVVCSVVFLETQEATTAVGVEFARPAPDFWPVSFPLPRAREAP